MTFCIDRHTLEKKKLTLNILHGYRHPSSDMPKDGQNPEFALRLVKILNLHLGCLMGSMI